MTKPKNTGTTAKKTPPSHSPAQHPVPDTHADTAVIIIRGLGREQRHWGEFPAQLTSQSPCEIFSIDMPGNGELVDRESPMTLKPYADYLQSALNNLPLGHYRDVRLVAISMGAMVVLKWLERCGHSAIRAFTLINTSCGMLSPFYKRLIPTAVPFLTTFLGKDDIRAKEQAILALVANNEQARAANLDRWVAIHQERTTLPGNLVRQMLASASFRQLTVPRLKDRITFVASRADRMVHYSCSESLADYLGCPLILHDSAGHDIPLDDPVWLARTIWSEQAAPRKPVSA